MLGFPGGTHGKESACNAGKLGSIPGLGDPLEGSMATHSSILAWRTPMGRGAWRAMVAKSQTRLSDSLWGVCVHITVKENSKGRT